jgi:hypothetical protein
MGDNRIVFPLAVCLLPLALVFGCTPKTIVLSGDRHIVHETDGSYRVTEVWMQERYQLERALRLRLERCEADGAGPGARGERPETK